MESITGIGNVEVQRTEYLSPAVLKRYTSNIGILKTIMNYQNTPNYQPSLFDYNNIITALNDLYNLAHNGITEGNPDNPIKSYLNGSMADNLNLIMKSLKSVGISPDSSLITIMTTPSEIASKLESLQQWQSLNGFGVGQLLTDGVKLLVTGSQVTWTDPLEIDPTTGENRVRTAAYSSQSTFQSMLEVEYVATGNNVISSQLTSMETALTVTKDLLDILKVIQNLSNNVRVVTDRQATYTIQGTTTEAPIGTQSFSSIFQMPTTGNPGTAVRAYSAAAGKYFSQLSVEPTGNTTATELYKAKIDLYNALLRLESVDPQNTRNIENSLAANIFAVVSDISGEFAAITVLPPPYTTKEEFLLANPSAFDTIFASATNKWVIDSQNVKLNVDSTSTNTKYQSHLATAITNSEILNDQQRDNVRRYILVFEEFYKSAASMLEILSTTIQKLGRKSAGG